MAALRAALLVVSLLAASPAGAQSVADWRPYMTEASTRFGVPIAWIERVMQAESAGRRTLDGRPITSPAGAMGLMQVMPATWTAMRSAYGLGIDPYDPHDNILAGTAYLRAMYDRFGYPGLFAAYNAGPGRYAEYLAGGRALPAETRTYVAAVAGASTTAARAGPGVAARAQRSLPTLFAVRGEAAMVSPPAAAPASASGLFMPLSVR